MYKPLSQVLGGLAALTSLFFVAYELKRNNDIAVVQSQYELIALQNDLRAMLADPNILRVVMTRDLTTLTEARGPAVPKLHNGMVRFVRACFPGC